MIIEGAASHRRSPSIIGGAEGPVRTIGKRLVLVESGYHFGFAEGRSFIVKDAEAVVHTCRQEVVASGRIRMPLQTP